MAYRRSRTADRGRAARHAALVALVAAATLVLTGSALAQQTSLDRSKRPIAPPPPTVTLPKIDTRTLSNGMVVAVVENHELPIVAVRTATTIGGILDPVGKEGVAQLVQQMLPEGTTTRTADQLAEAFADLGNSVSANGFTTITRNVDASLALMADMVMNPAFPQAALDRVKQNAIAGLRRAKDQPAFTAGQIFSSVVYGQGHPYERSATEQSLGGITRDDLVAFHAAYFRPQNVKLVVAGDITPDQAVQKLEPIFGPLAQGGKVARVDVPAPKGVGQTTIYLFDRPNSPQSVIRVGHVGPRRDTPEYYALQLMNTVFGGLSGSRLNQNLREKRAYTYGANSALIFRRPPETGTFLSSSEVVSPKTDSALVQWMIELRDIRGPRAVTLAELEFAKNNRILGLARQFESVDGLAQSIAGLLTDELPLDFYDRLSDNYRNVTLGELNAAAATHLDPEHVAIVIVGDRKVIEPGLRAANIAPIVIVDESGKPMAN